MKKPVSKTAKRIAWLERENSELNSFIQSMQADNKRLLDKAELIKHHFDELEKENEYLNEENMNIKKENAALKEELDRIN